MDAFGYDIRAVEPASTTGTFVVWLGAASAAERKRSSITRFLYFHTSSININIWNGFLFTGLPLFRPLRHPTVHLFGSVDITITDIHGGALVLFVG